MHRTLSSSASLLDEPDLDRPTGNLQILDYAARFDPMP